MTNKPKQIGTRAEKAVVDFLRANGWPHAERRALRGTSDAGDVTGTPALCWEVKGGKAAWEASDVKVIKWLMETETERTNAHADLGILVIQRRGYGPARAGWWWAVLPLWQLLWLHLQADRDPFGVPAYTASAETFAIGASDPATPWMDAPVRLLLEHVCSLLVAAGYGTAPANTHASSQASEQAVEVTVLSSTDDRVHDALVDAFTNPPNLTAPEADRG